MSRTVSIRLPTVHSATSAPSQRKMPVRAVITSRIGPDKAFATVGGIVENTAATARSPPTLPPNRLSAAARDRKRDAEGKSVSVRVDLGGRRINKKKKHSKKITQKNNK